MTMTMKEHMEMMDRIRQGENSKPSKSRTIKISIQINKTIKK